MSDELRRLAGAATPIYGGAYAVDREGRVFSFVPWRGQSCRQLVPVDKGDGYLKVRITLTGRRFNILVHQLVCANFHGDRPTSSHEVRHLDGNKLDNRADNLAWGTAAENAGDRERHGRTARGEANGAAALTTDDVLAIHKQLAVGASQRDVARAWGVSPRAVGRIARGETWGHVADG